MIIPGRNISKIAIGSTDVVKVAIGSIIVYQLLLEDLIAPIVDSILFGTQESDGDLPLTITALSENSTIGIVFTSSDQSAATASAIRTAAEGGTALTDQLSFDTQAASPGGGPYTITDGVPSGRNGATFYQIAIWDTAGNTQSTTYTGSVNIDTTAPTFSSAASNSAGTEIVITFTENMADASVNAADWSVNDVTGGSATVGTPVVSTNTITLPLSGNTVQVGDSPTVDYSGGSVTDAFGNALADFVDQTVTNNVASSGLVATSTYEEGGGGATLTPASLGTLQSNDVIFLVHQWRNEPQGIADVPTGYTQAGSTLSSDVGGISFGLAIYWKRLTGNESPPGVNLGAPATGNHAVTALAFRGLKTSGNPWNSIQTNVENNISFAGQTPPAITTTNTDDIGFIAAAWGEDCTDQSITFSTSGDFGARNIEEQFTDAGMCGCVAVLTSPGAAGSKATGNLAPTMVDNAYRGAVTFSLELA